MHALLAFVSVILVIVLGLAWASHCGHKAMARMREKELDELPRTNPAYYRPLRESADEARRVAAIIARNERVIQEGITDNLTIDDKAAARLICHPVILCRYTATERFPIPDTKHGLRHAVWLKDMTRPLCPVCMVVFVANGLEAKELTQHA